MKNQILNAINSANENELIELNNAYCDAINDMNGTIYSNDEDFFATFYPNAGDGLKVAQAVFYGDYNYSHNWVQFNGYGNLQSYSYIEAKDLFELPETMAEYIAENFEDFESLTIFSNIEIETEA